MTSWWVRFPSLANCSVAYTVTTLSSLDFWVLILTIRMYKPDNFITNPLPPDSTHTHSEQAYLLYCASICVLLVLTSFSFLSSEKINGQSRTHTTVAQRLKFMDFSGGGKLVNQFACEQKLSVNNTHYGGSVIKTGASFNRLFGVGGSLWTEIAREQNCMWITP